MSKRRLLKSSLIFCMTNLALGCMSQKSAGSLKDFGSATSGNDVCARHHTGTTTDFSPGISLEICDAFYPTDPMVRPPADDLTNSASVTIYGGFSMDSGYVAIQDRNGVAYVVLDASGNPINPHPDVNLSALPASMQMPTHLYLYTVYQFQGQVADMPASLATDGATGTSASYQSSVALKTISLSSATPVIYIPGTVIDGYWLGAWEGQLPKRIDPAPTTVDFHTKFFDDSALVPFRFTFNSIAASTLPVINSVWQGAGVLKEAVVAQAEGSVDNFSGPALAFDGSCLPSLADLGASNPFQGAIAPAVSFFRSPGMHTSTTNVSVLSFPQGTAGLPGTGMGNNLLSPTRFIQVAPTSLWLATQVEPHGGLDQGFHVYNVHKVQGGGGSCTTGQ